MRLISQDLHDGWRLTPVTGPLAGRTVPATGPGSTHLDLLAAGLIADPYLDRVEADLVWPHRADWRYDLTFPAAPAAEGERVDLVFDGLDTVARVELNGVALGRSANMHRGHRHDVRELLRETNELTVHFGSALAYAEERGRELGPLTGHPFAMVRKMACSFGWDWGPDLQTAGIWRPVRLERWREARLADVRPLVTVNPDGTGRVETHVRVERAGDAHLILTAGVPGYKSLVVLEPGRHEAVLTLDVPNIKLWWPVGYGEQPRYDLTVAVRPQLPGMGRTHEVHRRIGFRTITVNTEPDEAAPRSPSSSTASRCSPGVPTGSPTTTSSPAPPARGSPAGWTRRSRPT